MEQQTTANPQTEIIIEETLQEPAILAAAPHEKSSVTTQKLMANVVIALIPTLIASGILFGWRALLLVAVTVLSSIIFEYLWCRIRKEDQSIGNLSAVVTGLILAFNLPPGLPLYMAVIGSFIAIIVVKEVFGGLGRNFANPAAVARIVLSISFAAPMTSYIAPQVFGQFDAITSATPLTVEAGTIPLTHLLFGLHPGMIGETCSIAILLGLIWLLATRTISIIIPATLVATVALVMALAGQNALEEVLSGGLLFAAVFMATDYVTSPMTQKGKVVFAIGIGLITCVIRLWGNLPEGVAYAILIMNIFVPYIDQLTRTLPLGGEKRSWRKKKEA